MRFFALLISGLFLTLDVSAQELPPPGDQAGQAYIKIDPPNQLNILSAGKLISTKCTNFTTHEDVKNLPRKGYYPGYLPDYTICFRWDASDEYETDSLDGKCIRMRYGGIGRMKEIQKSQFSENILKYGTSHNNVYAFGFVYEHDYKNAQQSKKSSWLPVMNVLEYSC